MKRTIKIILIFLLLFSSFSFKFKEKNFDLGNGIWIHIDTFENVKDEDLDNLCKFLIKRNIRNVFILAKDLNGELLYKKYEKTLLKINKFFKNYYIRIHFYIPIGYDEKFLKENPEEASYHSPDKENYNTYPDKDLKVVNLNSKKYLNYIKKIVKELIYYYDAEGIQLDYIRYPNVYFGYDEWVKKELLSRGGNWDKIMNIFRKGDNIFTLFDEQDKDILLLSKVRSEVVTNFANEIKSFINSISKEILFSVTLIQSGSSFLSYKEGGKDSFPYGFLHFGQDYKSLSEICDFVSPLAYHKNYEKDIEWVREIIRNTKKKVSSKILCGIQANDTNENLEKLIKITEEENVNFSLFRLGTFIPIEIKLKSIDTLKYEIEFNPIYKFYENKFNSTAQIKIPQLNILKQINLNEKFQFLSEKSFVEIYINSSYFLTDKSTLNLLNTIKFKIGDSNYYIDGVKKTSDAKPFVFGGRTMVPIRIIGESLGYDVLWKNGIVELKKGDLIIRFFINERRILINEKEFYIDSSPIIKDGRTYLPIRYVAEALNLIVSWIEETKEVIIEGFIDSENFELIIFRDNDKSLIRDIVFNKSK
ncbi:MAG: hypothetical protein H5U37_06265, partial [Caldisericia bacterium]|nr:hypothetical protein [Caldisericia bacterium]